LHELAPILGYEITGSGLLEFAMSYIAPGRTGVCVSFGACCY